MLKSIFLSLFILSNLSLSFAQDVEPDDSEESAPFQVSAQYGNQAFSGGGQSSIGMIGGAQPDNSHAFSIDFGQEGLEHGFNVEVFHNRNQAFIETPNSDNIQDFDMTGVQAQYQHALTLAKTEGDKDVVAIFKGGAGIAVQKTTKLENGFMFGGGPYLGAGYSPGGLGSSSPGSGGIYGGGIGLPTTTTETGVASQVNGGVGLGYANKKEEGILIFAVVDKNWQDKLRAGIDIQFKAPVVEEDAFQIDLKVNASWKKDILPTTISQSFQTPGNEFMPASQYDYSQSYSAQEIGVGVEADFCFGQNKNFCALAGVKFDGIVSSNTYSSSITDLSRGSEAFSNEFSGTSFAGAVTPYAGIKIKFGGSGQ